MARNESDRDDLLAELRTAVPRWELQVPFQSEPVVAGIRSEGRLSVYFSPDRCYHFDGCGGLRRSFVDGALYRSAGTTLSRLIRSRSSTHTYLDRYDLTAAELGEFLVIMRQHLAQLHASLVSREVTILRAVPEEGETLPELLQSVAQALDTESPLSPALRP
ncbi:MAG: hypothetical protein KDA58_10010 [Planctomycetaceae bacterium]|nr:hypothetical protein [Planctomycetaceae bacterium]